MISKIRLSQICGYFFILIHSLSKGLSLSQSDNIYYFISIISLCVLAIKAINCEFHKKEFLFYFISVFLAIIVYLLSGNLTILLSVMAIFACKDLNVKSLVKIILFTRILAFMAMFLLSNMDVIPDNDILFNRGNDILYRKSFGYLHPNETALQLIIISTSAILLLEKRKNKNIGLLILFLLNYWMYKATYSRSSFLIILMFLIMEGLIVNFRIFSILIRKFSGVIIVIPILITIVFMICYGKVGFLYEVNELLTGRVQYAYIIGHYTLPKLFGINYGEFDLEKIYIDNGFIKLLYIDGIIFFILMIPFAFALIKKFKKYPNADYLVVMIMFFFYAITESSFDNAINTYIWLLSPAVLIKNKFKEAF